MGVKDIIQHKETCEKKQSCVRCKGAHEANDVRCSDIMFYRSILTKSLLSSVSAINSHRSNDIFNNTGKIIDELFNKMNMVDQNLNRTK
jgi:hypothetical protein